MPAPGTFAPDRRAGLPACTHYDAAILHDALVSGAGRIKARDLADAFGFHVERNGRRWRLDTLPHHAIRAVDDALGRHRPDLDHAIWTTLLTTTRERPATICPTGLALLVRTGVHPGAALLLAVVNDVSSPGTVDNFQFVSADGSDQIWLDVPTIAPEPRHVRVMSASIGRNAFWSDDSIGIVGIPETALALLPGRPLTDLLRHPDLDPLGLTITGIQPAMEHETVTTDDARPRLDIARLCEDALSRIRA